MKKMRSKLMMLCFGYSIKMESQKIISLVDATSDNELRLIAKNE